MLFSACPIGLEHKGHTSLSISEFIPQGRGRRETPRLLLSKLGKSIYSFDHTSVLVTSQPLNTFQTGECWIALKAIYNTNMLST